MNFRIVPAALLLTACALSASLAATTPVDPAPKPWTPRPGAGAGTAPAGQEPAARPVMFADTVHYLPDTTWLIKVGPRITRVKDFVAQYNAAYAADRPASDSLGLVKFMNTLITHDVLGLTARALNRPLDFEDRAALRETEERALSDVFYQRFVTDVATVSDAEVQEYAVQRGLAGHFRHIIISDRQTAERVRAELVSGKLTWTAAVNRYSLLKPTPKNPDGDAGWVTRIKLADDIGPVLFRLQPGGIAPVLSSPGGGYDISQMVELRKVPAPSPTAFLPSVRRRLAQYHASVLADSIQSSIRAQVSMVFDTTNVRFACSHFSQSLSVKRDGYGTNIEISGEVPDFSPADTSRILARWNGGGRYSLGEFMGWFQSLNPLARPDVTFPEGMTGVIAGVVLEPFRATLARERGIDKDPEFVARVESKREQILVEHMYQDSVGSRVWASKEERRAYYDSHKPDFFTYPSVDFAMIYRYNRAGADSIVKALDAGSKPWDIIAADSARGEKTGSIQHRGQQEHGNYYKVLFEELRPGHSTVVGPDSDGIYGVINLINYDGGRQLTFEESQLLADQRAQEAKSEALLNAWLDRLRKRFHIESRPELVTRVQIMDEQI